MRLTITTMLLWLLSTLAWAQGTANKTPAPAQGTQTGAAAPAPAGQHQPQAKSKEEFDAYNQAAAKTEFDAIGVIDPRFQANLRRQLDERNAKAKK